VTQGAAEPPTSYARIEDIPPEMPIPLTEIEPHGGRWDYSDYGANAYCSECGRESARRARGDLWAIRHQTREDLPGPVWTYCRDHLPTREWTRGEDGRGSHVREVECPECFMLAPVGSICDTTGLPHKRP